MRALAKPHAVARDCARSGAQPHGSARACARAIAAMPQPSRPRFAPTPRSRAAAARRLHATEQARHHAHHARIHAHARTPGRTRCQRHAAAPVPDPFCLPPARTLTHATPRTPRQQAGESMEFEGSILQDVRAGQAGFSTRLTVEQSGGAAAAAAGADAAAGPGAAEGDTVTLTYTTVVDGADDGPATALQARPFRAHMTHAHAETLLCLTPAPRCHVDAGAGRAAHLRGGC
jgi:hypothetical protein